MASVRSQQAARRGRSPALAQSPGRRLATLDWSALAASVDEHGCATTRPLLSARECASLAGLYESDAFRSRVVMARHGFGRGEYKYFSYPLPDIVSALRT